MPERGKDLADAIELAAVSPCFDKEALADEIERWLERRVVDSRLRIKVTRTADALSFALVLGDARPEYRDFTELPSDCPGERRMIALSIALAIDAVSPREPSSGGTARFGVLADGMVATSVERPALGGGVDLRTRLTPAFWPGIGFFATFAKDQPVRDDIPARFDDSIVAARVEGCLVLPASRTIDVAGCAEALFGSLTIVSTAVDDAGSEGQFWAGGALAVELHVRFTRAFGIHAGVDGVLSARAARVRVLGPDGQSAVERDLPRVALSVRLGPSAYF